MLGSSPGEIHRDPCPNFVVGTGQVPRLTHRRLRLKQECRGRAGRGPRVRPGHGGGGSERQGVRAPTTRTFQTRLGVRRGLVHLPACPPAHLPMAGSLLLLWLGIFSSSFVPKWEVSLYSPPELGSHLAPPGAVKPGSVESPVTGCQCGPGPGLAVAPPHPPHPPPSPRETRSFQPLAALAWCRCWSAAGRSVAGLRQAA